MNVQREILWKVGLLVAFNLFLSIGAIGLLGRVGPAVDRILRENVYSISAAESILATFATADNGTVSGDGRKVLADALERANNNVTEKEEPAVLDRLADAMPAAADGDLAARERVVQGARALIDINRRAMQRADESARRLGVTGAWAAVFVGFASFLLSIVVFSRVQKRMIEPLIEIHETLSSAESGERLRRCRPCEAPREIVRVMESVNRLLDERLARRR